MEKPTRPGINTRIVRPGDDAHKPAAPSSPSTDSLDPDAAARIDAVWELTLLCLAWRPENGGEHRLQRSLTRVQRPDLSREDLIRNKRASGRTQDLAEFERLESPDPS